MKFCRAQRRSAGVRKGTQLQEWGSTEDILMVLLSGHFSHPSLDETLWSRKRILAWHCGKSPGSESYTLMFKSQPLISSEIFRSYFFIYEVKIKIANRIVV